MRCFVSWSGGKDSCLALWRALQSGADVRCLLTTCSRETGRTMVHGLPVGLLRCQAEALGLPLALVHTDWPTYERDYRRALGDLGRQDIETGVFGDIDLIEHRRWAEKVTGETGMAAWLPLWGEDQAAILRHWVSAGFEALLVACRADALGPAWLGRRLDLRCVIRLERWLRSRGRSPSGEQGEYHTLVVDGPIFRRRLNVEEALPVLRGSHWVLDIRGFSSTPRV